MQFEKDNDREITLLGCHSFCSECILPWLEEHNDTCPVCRKKVDIGNVEDIEEEVKKVVENVVEKVVVENVEEVEDTKEES